MLSLDAEGLGKASVSVLMKGEHDPSNCHDEQVSPRARAACTDALMSSCGSPGQQLNGILQVLAAGGCTASRNNTLPHRGTPGGFSMKVVVLLCPPAISLPACQLDKTSIGTRMQAVTTVSKFVYTWGVDTHNIQWSRSHPYWWFVWSAHGFRERKWMLLVLPTCFSISPFSFIPSRVALCCCPVLFGCWSLPALIEKQLCLGSFITPLFSPQQTVEVKYCFSASEHHVSLKAELTKEILMFPRTAKVMLSATSISRKCLCSVLWRLCFLNCCQCLSWVQQHQVSSVLFKFLRQAYPWGIWGMILKWNKKTNPKLFSKGPSKKS